MLGLTKRSHNKHDGSHPVVFPVEQTTCVQSNVKQVSFNQLNCLHCVPSGLLIQGKYTGKYMEGLKAI